MENLTAEQIGRKARALKHCVKLIKEIDLKGQAIVTLNCTGVSFTVTKGDAMYFKIAATKANLASEIASYEFIKHNVENSQENSPTTVVLQPQV